MNKFIFPENLIDPGINFLDYEIPWIVPDSLYFLDNLLNSNDTVLDIGSGGSTIYFLKTCKKVYSIETDKEWFDLVNDRIDQKNLRENLTYCNLEFEKINDYIQKITDAVTVTTIDTINRKNRTNIFEKIIFSKNKPEIIILDNWGSKKVFKSIFNLTGKELIDMYGLQQYQVFDFLYPGWFGNGTRILVHESRLKDQPSI